MWKNKELTGVSFFLSLCLFVNRFNTIQRKHAIVHNNLIQFLICFFSLTIFFLPFERLLLPFSWYSVTCRIIFITYFDNFVFLECVCSLYNLNHSSKLSAYCRGMVWQRIEISFEFKWRYTLRYIINAHTKMFEHKGDGGRHSGRARWRWRQYQRPFKEKRNCVEAKCDGGSEKGRETVIGIIDICVRFILCFFLFPFINIGPAAKSALATRVFSAAFTLLCHPLFSSSIQSHLSPSLSLNANPFISINYIFTFLLWSVAWNIPALSRFDFFDRLCCRRLSDRRRFMRMIRHTQTMAGP